MRRIRVAVVGLEFGASFIPALAAHAGVEAIALCDTNAATLARVAGQCNVPPERQHASLEAVLAEASYDAVMLFTPIPDHARHVLASFAAGKHVACAVPMAQSIEDIRAVIDARRKSGRVYMMMETSLYSPEFLFARQLHDAGEFGRIQFLRGVWQVSLENHARYWNGLPPMHYITHPLAPILTLASARAVRVCAMGSGVMRREFHGVYGNPFPIETAVLELAAPDGQPLAAEVSSLTLEASFQSKEVFDVYGTRQTFVWETFHGDQHALVRTQPAMPGGAKYPPTTVFRFAAPSFHDRLPRELRRVQPRSAQPHLVHEFVSAVLEHRPSAIDVAQAATICAPGICAHQSAMARGAAVDVPSFA